MIYSNNFYYITKPDLTEIYCLCKEVQRHNPSTSSIYGNKAKKIETKITDFMVKFDLAMKADKEEYIKKYK